MPGPAFKTTLSTDANAMFSQVETKRRGSIVADQVLSAIREGRLAPGDQLPSERDLALQTGISRPSVREAVSALELIGVVTCHPGQRTVVTDEARDVATLSAALPDLASGAMLAEALVVRRLIEVASADLLVAGRNDDDAAELDAALEELRAAASRRAFEAYTAANRRFHEALAAAAGNQLLQRILHPLMNMMLGGVAQELRQRRYAHEPAFFDANLSAHEDIAAAYRAGDLPGLRAAIAKHYEVVERSL